MQDLKGRLKAKVERNLAAIDRASKEVKSALEKWVKSEKYAPQLDNAASKALEMKRSIDGIVRRVAAAKNEDVDPGSLSELIERLSAGGPGAVTMVGSKAGELKDAMIEFIGVVQQVEHSGATSLPKFKKIVKDVLRMTDQLEMVQFSPKKFVQ